MLAGHGCWFTRFIGARPIKRKGMHEMSASLNDQPTRWQRTRKFLGDAFGFLSNRRVQRRNAREKANDGLAATQADLQRRWRYLEEAQKLSHSGIFGWKVPSGELVWSAETRRIFGLENETNPTVDLVFDRIHPEDRDRMRQVKEHAVANGTDFDVEHRILLPDGTVNYARAV